MTTEGSPDAPGASATAVVEPIAVPTSSHGDPERREDAAAISDVRRSAIRGTLWNYSVFLVGKLVLFATTVVLARLLTPEIYGLMALALVIIIYADALNEFGISAAVVYLEDERRSNTTAFWLSLITGAASTVLVFLLAPALASLFDEPELVPVVRVLSLSFVIISLGSVHQARLRRRLAFARRVGPELAKSVVKAGISIGLAVVGFGVWSLVWGQLAAVTVATVGYWLVLRWWPVGPFDMGAARRIIRYGSQTMVVTFLGVVVRDMDYLIIAAGLGAASLGYYTLGFRVPDLVLMGVCYAVSQTLFPVLSRVRHDADALGRAYCRSMGTLALVTVPLGFGLFLVAIPFVEVVYGGTWEQTGPVLQLISLYFVFQTVQFVSGDVYKATGRQKLLIWISLARVPIGVALLLAVVDDGIVAVATAQVALSALVCAVQLGVASKMIGVGARPILAALAPAAAGGAAMVVSVSALQGAVPDASSWVVLGASVVVGAITYVPIAGYLGRSMVASVWKGLIRRRRSAVAA